MAASFTKGPYKGLSGNLFHKLDELLLNTPVLGRVLSAGLTWPLPPRTNQPASGSNRTHGWGLTRQIWFRLSWGRASFPAHSPPSQRLSIIHPAYRCVDSSDRWQWLQLWRQLIHFNEISPKWYKQNQSKFTLTQECKIVFH